MQYLNLGSNHIIMFSITSSVIVKTNHESIQQERSSDKTNEPQSSTREYVGHGNDCREHHFSHLD